MRNIVTQHNLMPTQIKIFWLVMAFILVVLVLVSSLALTGHMPLGGVVAAMVGAVAAAFVCGTGLLTRDIASARFSHPAGKSWGQETCNPSDSYRGHPLFDAFMAHMPALAFLKDRQGRYLYVNDACASMWGWSPEAVIGKCDCDLWPDKIAGPLCQNDQQIMDSQQLFNAVDRIVVGAQERFHLVTKFAVRLDGQNVLGGIAFDITDRVRAEEENRDLQDQLIQSQKMEAIGTLAGGIAHDFNNVLAAIMGYAELAQFDAPAGSTVGYELNQVLKATQRARDLVRQILSFSRKTGHDRKPVDAVPLVQEVLTLLRASIPSTIEIRSQFEADGFHILTNATQFHQVMMNLCTNAAHAMEETGGVLEVTLQKISLSGLTAGRQGVAPGRYLEVRVRDNGPGIPAAMRKRIFDPYFTTKVQGKGSGMGLAVVRSIVQSHGGAIDVESHPGHGACFCVLMPITSQLTEIESEANGGLPNGDASILFVDDESVLADLGKQMLSRLGYQVTGCDRSLDALALFQEDPERFDLVITDATMPDMTGDVLASRMLSIRPDIPIILCTGYSEQITEERVIQMGLSAFLMKPLAIADLALTVRQVLDTHRHGPQATYKKAACN